MYVAFTWVFLAALGALATATRLWLAQRQIRHVRAHREAVPAMFADSIPLPAHQKAADYTVAKARLGIVDTLVDALILLALTLGGALQWLSDLWQRVFGESIWHGTALILSLLLIKGALGLPLQPVPHLRHRGALRLQPHDVEALRHRPREGPAVGAVLGVPLLLVVLWLVLAGRRPLWWLYVWLVLVAYSLFLQMIYPAVVMPLFNKFSPLEDPALAGRIEGS